MSLRATPRGAGRAAATQLHSPWPWPAVPSCAPCLTTAPIVLQPLASISSYSVREMALQDSYATIPWASPTGSPLAGSSETTAWMTFKALVVKRSPTPHPPPEAPPSPHQERNSDDLASWVCICLSRAAFTWRETQEPGWTHGPEAGKAAHQAHAGACWMRRLPHT